MALCVFCGLSDEFAELIFNLCIQTQVLSIKIVELIGEQSPILFPDSISVGKRLEHNKDDFSNFKASVIVVIVWFVWKAHCDHIFKNKIPNYNWISRKALDHVQEIVSSTND